MFGGPEYYDLCSAAQFSVYDPAKGHSVTLTQASQPCLIGQYSPGRPGVHKQCPLYPTS